MMFAGSKYRCFFVNAPFMLDVAMLVPDLLGICCIFARGQYSIYEIQMTRLLVLILELITVGLVMHA